MPPLSRRSFATSLSSAALAALAPARARSSPSSDATAKAQGALLALCLLNIAYVVGISSAFTFLEESRYRYQVESLIWLTTAVCVTDVLARFVTATRQRPA